MRAPADWKVVVLAMLYITLPANMYLALGLRCSNSSVEISQRTASYVHNMRRASLLGRLRMGAGEQTLCSLAEAALKGTQQSSEFRYYVLVCVKIFVVN